MNKKILSATAVKYIAVLAMTIDYVAFMFVPPESLLYFMMRLIGRLTAPIMSFFIVEGFIHTRNYKKYFFRMFAFAIISQPFYFIMIFRRTPQNTSEFLMHLNVMFNFCVSLIMLKIVSGKLRTEKKIFLSGICFMLADLCDWSFIIPVWVLIFFFFRNSTKIRTLLFISMSVILMILKNLEIYNIGVIMAIVPIALYNGKRSEKNRKINRWFFYIYYPLHIAVIEIFFFSIVIF
ncbi:MAG: conjugal transfer protein TraX, partial [Ruminococcus sp.]|nr:conjugal transfer protein TraX [Ruminococcus sp.]MDE6848425.1 conjugal transfer protein TraX [Ruminococcus sp.]